MGLILIAVLFFFLLGIGRPLAGTDVWRLLSSQILLSALHLSLMEKSRISVAVLYCYVRSLVKQSFVLDAKTRDCLCCSNVSTARIWACFAV